MCACSCGSCHITVNPQVMCTKVPDDDLKAFVLYVSSLTIVSSWGATALLRSCGCHNVA